MSVECPKCGSRNLRFSRSRSLPEKMKKLLGIRALRCRDCQTRFLARTWSVSDVAYARCPKCWRMDLNRWSDRHFRPPAYMSLALRLGANPYRCEYCRYNFASFRRRKEKFSFHRWEKLRGRNAPEAGPQVPEAPAAPAPPTAPLPGPAPVAPRAPAAQPATAAEAIAMRKAAEARRRGPA